MNTIELNFFDNVFTISINGCVECNTDLYYDDNPYLIISNELSQYEHDELKGLDIDEITRELISTGHVVLVN